MTLLLDLGNTRLKAAQSDAGSAMQVLGEASHRELGMAGALARALGGASPGAASAWCANVAGPAAGEALVAAGRFDHAEKLLVEITAHPTLRKELPKLVGALCRAAGDKKMPLRLWRAHKKKRPSDAAVAGLPAACSGDM